MGDLPHLPVTSHLGATLNFETLERQVSELQEQGKRHVSDGVGAWTALTLGAKVEENASFQTVRVRTEAGNTVARLRGIPKVKAGQTLGASETIATLPVGLRPPATVAYAGASGGAFNAFQISAAGVIIAEKTITEGQGVLFDGITFNLT